MWQNPQDAELIGICTLRAPAAHLLPSSGSRGIKGADAEDTSLLASLGADAKPTSGLFEAFGLRLFHMISVVEFGMRGFSYAVIWQTVPYFFRSYQVEGPQAQLFRSVVQLPWALKPMMGIVSDSFPVFGFNKAPYMALSALLGGYGLSYIGLVDKDELTIKNAVACLFLAELEISLCDLFVEAVYSKKIREHAHHGPAFMILRLAGINFAQMMAAVLLGVVLPNSGVKVPFLIAMVPCLFVLMPVLRNDLQETPKTEAEQAQFDERMAKQSEIWFLCILMLLGTVFLTVLGFCLHDHLVVNAIASVAVALSMLIGFSLVLRPDVAKVNVFMLLHSAMDISLSGAAFYFFTDTPSMYPEGPHFSMFFMTTVLGVASATFSLLALFVIYLIGTLGTYRNVLLIGNTIAIVLRVFDVVFFMRLNLKLGIPDHILVLGYSFFENFIRLWTSVPVNLLLSHFCAPNLEATMFALLAGCSNLGSTVALNCGAVLLQYLGCNPSGQANEEAQFENLWIAAIITIIVPLPILFLIPRLIPGDSLTTQIDKSESLAQMDVTSGSLWRQWLKSGASSEADASRL